MGAINKLLALLGLSARFQPFARILPSATFCRQKKLGQASVAIPKAIRSATYLEGVFDGSRFFSRQVFETCPRFFFTVWSRAWPSLR